MSKYNMTPSKLIKLLRQHGFVFVRQSGSHAIFKNDQASKKVQTGSFTRLASCSLALFLFSCQSFCKISLKCFM